MYPTNDMLAKQSNRFQLIDRKELVLWRHPWLTLVSFFKETAVDLSEYCDDVLQYRKTLAAIVFVCSSLYLAPMFVNSPTLVYVNTQLAWCSYWTFLGILSSIGFGTGVHTFVMYLGPHIAAVTMAAYECNSVKFPEPPYPLEIVCADDWNLRNWLMDMVNYLFDTNYTDVSVWDIANKVKVEAFVWGVGTALGELPSYFMARKARLTGDRNADEHYCSHFHDWLKSIQKFVERLVCSLGFWGIMLCAVIPNPLFDLVSIACGHFLVPFWTFFGATLIGKAFFKAMIQMMAVILAFNEHHAETFVALLKNVPRLGNAFEKSFKEFLTHQQLKMHRHYAQVNYLDKGLLEIWYDLFFLWLIVASIVSLINSTARCHHQRMTKALESQMTSSSNKKPFHHL